MLPVVIGTNVSNEPASLRSTLRREKVTVFGLQHCSGAAQCGGASEGVPIRDAARNVPEGADAVVPAREERGVRATSPIGVRYDRRTGRDDEEEDGAAEAPTGVSMD